MKEKNPSNGEVSNEQANVQNVACVLHAAGFGLWRAWRTSPEGADWEKVVREMHPMVRRLKMMKPELHDIRNVIASLEKSGLYHGVELIENRNLFTFKIERCMFAGGPGGVHSCLNPTDALCPVAIFIAAHLALERRPKKVYIHPTAYYDEGSTTKIELLSPPVYQARIEREKSMAKALAR